MIYEFGPDRSFSEEYEKVNLLLPFYKYIERNLVLLEPQLQEFNFLPRDNSVKGIGEIIQKENGSYLYTNNVESTPSNKEISITFKIEELGGEYSEYNPDDYLLEWAKIKTKEITRIILTNDRKIYLKAHRSGILVFRATIILYAGIELGLWDINAAKNAYNIWAKDPRAVPPDCDTWEVLMAKRGEIIKNNALDLKAILEKSHNQNLKSRKK
jgi:hypothetical protein